MSSFDRVQALSQPEVADAALAPVALGDLPSAPAVREDLARTVAAARALFADSREAATQEVLRALDAVMALPVKDASDILRELLDSNALEGLAAPDGMTARAKAAALLITLPWPHALQISPEDLAHLREVESAPRRQASWSGVPKVGFFPVALVTVGAGADLFLGSQVSPWWLAGTTVCMAAGAVHAGGLPSSVDPRPWTELATGTLFGVGVLAAVAPFFLGGGFFLGAGAFTAGLVAWMKR